MNLDGMITEFDRALRAVAGVVTAERPNPAQSAEEGELSEEEKRTAAALMRVNHCGEVCAQALYQGQALASSSAPIREALSQAAREEQDHLAWSSERIADLGGRTSFLNPLWYAGSLAIGMLAGKLGDDWNLGFLAETERQVEAHLAGHLSRLSVKDARTRIVVEAMQSDEARHAETARRLGARELPHAVKAAMRLAAKVMTATSYRI